jgi:hypothetical protein
VGRAEELPAKDAEDAKAEADEGGARENAGVASELGPTRGGRMRRIRRTRTGAEDLPAKDSEADSEGWPAKDAKGHERAESRASSLPQGGGRKRRIRRTRTIS